MNLMYPKRAFLLALLASLPTAGTAQPAPAGSPPAGAPTSKVSVRPDSATPATPSAKRPNTPATECNAFTAPEDRNAAIHYLNLMLAAGDNISKFGFSDYDKIGYDRAACEADPTCVAAQWALAYLNADGWVAASKLQKCDFELASEEGFGLILPQLGRMRAAARGLRFAARNAFIHNNSADGVAYLVAIIRMGNHISGDGILISSLVGQALGALALNETRTAAAAGKITQTDRDVLLASIATINPDDPMRIKAALRSERETMLNFVKRTYAGPDAGERLANMPGLFIDETSPRTIVQRKLLSEMDSTRLAEAVEQARPAYDAYLDLWESPTWKEDFAAVEDRVQLEEFGILATILMPSARHAKASQARLLLDIEEVTSALNAITTPQTAPIDPVKQLTPKPAPSTSPK